MYDICSDDSVWRYFAKRDIADPELRGEMLYQHRARGGFVSAWKFRYFHFLHLQNARQQLLTNPPDDYNDIYFPSS